MGKCVKLNAIFMIPIVHWIHPPVLDDWLRLCSIYPKSFCFLYRSSNCSVLCCYWFLDQGTKSLGNRGVVTCVKGELVCMTSIIAIIEQNGSKLFFCFVSKPFLGAGWDRKWRCVGMVWVLQPSCDFLQWNGIDGRMWFLIDKYKTTVSLDRKSVV